MNELIKKLAEQAGFETDRGPLLVPSPYIKVGGLCVGVPLEKFAELLVLECVTAVMDGTKEGDHYAMRIEHHFDNGPGGILQFGVEE